MKLRMTRIVGRAAAPLTFALALAATPALADFDAGLEAYQQGDFATALKEWRPLAEAGEAKAQFATAEQITDADSLLIDNVVPAAGGD